jgi:outer membrane protein
VKKSSVLLTILLLGFTTMTVQARELKIGTVSLQTVLERAPQVKQFQADLEKEMSLRAQEIKSKDKKLQSLTEQHTRDAAIMSEERRQEMEREIIELQRDTNRSKEEFREDMNLAKSRELKKLQKLIIEALDALGTEQNFDLIIQDPLFAADSLDVTEQVLKKLEVKN